MLHARSPLALSIALALVAVTAPAARAELSADATELDRIVVTGYTDPEGTEQYNQGLSERRAATIKRVVGESGLGHQNIVASGKGETNLVVSDCRKRFPNNARQRTLCDQPNRRVEIELYGSMAQPLN